MRTLKRIDIEKIISYMATSIFKMPQATTIRIPVSIEASKLKAALRDLEKIKNDPLIVKNLDTITKARARGVKFIFDNTSSVTSKGLGKLGESEKAQRVLAKLAHKGRTLDTRALLKFIINIKNST